MLVPLNKNLKSVQFNKYCQTLDWALKPTQWRTPFLTAKFRSGSARLNKSTQEIDTLLLSAPHLLSAPSSPLGRLQPLGDEHAWDPPVTWAAVSCASYAHELGPKFFQWTVNSLSWIEQYELLETVRMYVVNITCEGDIRMLNSWESLHMLKEAHKGWLYTGRGPFTVNLFPAPSASSSWGSE